jgi:hypothetical protein
MTGLLPLLHPNNVLLAFFSSASNSYKLFTSFDFASVPSSSLKPSSYPAQPNSRRCYWSNLWPQNTCKRLKNEGRSADALHTVTNRAQHVLDGVIITKHPQNSAYSRNLNPLRLRMRTSLILIIHPPTYYETPQLSLSFQQKMLLLMLAAPRRKAPLSLTWKYFKQLHYMSVGILSHALVSSDVRPNKLTGATSGTKYSV